MNIKKDFPVFNDSSLVYLDSCSSTQKPKYVIDAISEHLSSWYANIHRWLYDLSDISQELYDKSKKIVWKHLWVKASEVVYTYNSTYAFNILAYSLYFSNYLKKWDKILLSIAEHHSNIVPWLSLQEKFWIQVEFVQNDDNGDIDMQDFNNKYDETVKLVSFNYVSNVTWTIFDLKKIWSILRDDTLFVIDWSQAVPNFPVNFDDLWADFLVFTWHKLMANTWIWVLIWKKDHLKKINSIFAWWGSIKDVNTQWYELLLWAEWFEAWTPNISWAVSLLKAFEYIESIWWFDKVWQKEQELTKYMLDWFLQRENKIELIGKKTPDNRLWVFSFVLKWDFSPIRFGEHMAMKNICIRCGGHCAHPYLKSMWYAWSCRASLYLYNDFSDIDRFFYAIDEFI